MPLRDTSMVCVIQLVGRSGSGKTSAIASAVEILKGRGVRVAVVKHSHHDIDVKGKDTKRFREAGADLVIFSGPKGCVMFFPCNPLDAISASGVQVVLVEGSAGMEAKHRIDVEEIGRHGEVVEEILRASEQCVSSQESG
jgi:molybdopterin-guanine dinucleotide biosynthesis protein B